MLQTPRRDTHRMQHAEPQKRTQKQARQSRNIAAESRNEKERQVKGQLAEQPKHEQEDQPPPPPPPVLHEETMRQIRGSRRMARHRDEDANLLLIPTSCSSDCCNGRRFTNNTPATREVPSAIAEPLSTEASLSLADRLMRAAAASTNVTTTKHEPSIAAVAQSSSETLAKRIVSSSPAQEVVAPRRFDSAGVPKQKKTMLPEEDLGEAWEPPSRR